MSLLFPSLALALTALLPGPQAAAPAGEQELAARLASAVDRTDPVARRGAVAELIALGRPLEDWRAACGSFGRFEAAPRGSQVLEATLGNGEGADRPTEIHVHVPASYDPSRPAPLLLALHGAGSDGAQALRPWVATAEALGLLVVAPTDHGANAGYAYSAAERAATLSALRFARRRFNVDEDRIHLTGVSRGGHLAWDLALRHPDHFASLAPMIGGPRLDTRGQNNLRYLEHLVGLPLRDLQGARDDPRLLANLELAFERLARWKAPDAELVLFEDLGHSFRAEAVDWIAFLGAAHRNPRGDRRVRLAAGPGPHRHGWVEVLRTEGQVAESFAPEVEARRWNRLDEDGQRRELQQLVDARTARLEVERQAPGRFRAQVRDVRSFRLLLEPDDLPARGPAQVRVGSKTRRLDARAEVRVLLEEFVERFDRRFLPVAELVVETGG